MLYALMSFSVAVFLMTSGVIHRFVGGDPDFAYILNLRNWGFSITVWVFGLTLLAAAAFDHLARRARWVANFAAPLLVLTSIELLLFGGLLPHRNVNFRPADNQSGQNFHDSVEFPIDPELLFDPLQLAGENRYHILEYPVTSYTPSILIKSGLYFTSRSCFSAKCHSANGMIGVDFVILSMVSHQLEIKRHYNLYLQFVENPKFASTLNAITGVNGGAVRLLSGGIQVGSGNAVLTALNEIKDPSILSRFAFIEGSLPEKLTASRVDETNQPPGTWGLYKFGLGTATFEVEMDRPGLLYYADSNYPGWKVTVDGIPSEILTANYFAKAVALEPGKHRVQFVYSPHAYMFSFLLRMLAFVYGLGILVMTAFMVEDNNHKAGTMERI